MPRHNRRAGPALLEALGRGDRTALAEITQVITGYLVRYGGLEHRDQWDDLVQDVLVAMLRAAKQGRIRDERAFVHYAGITARNKLVDFFRRRRAPGEPELFGEAQELSGRRDMREGKRAPDLLMDLERALESLPEVERRVVEEIYVKGHSYEEAAKRVRMPLGSLKRYQSRGLKQLRSKMGLVGDRAQNAVPSPKGGPR